MNEPLSFEQLDVGACWRGPARTVTEADVVNFAGLTGDYNRLHVDHEYARSSPFKRPVAHGLLGLSLVAGLGSHSPAVQTAAFLGVSDWSFLRPLYIGDTVCTETEVIAKEPKGRRRGLVKWRHRLINQMGQVLQEGVFETLVEVAAAEHSGPTRVPSPKAMPDVLPDRSHYAS